jgi:hypothetical protein
MTNTYKDALKCALHQVREAEIRLEEEEDIYAAASHEECTVHNNMLRAGADQMDEQLRHEEEITQLRAPLDAARAVCSDAINSYWRAYRRPDKE